MATLHATPYGHYDNYAGFYFDSLEDYQAKYDAAEEQHGCEEYEIQFIDGSKEELQLFNTMKVSQANIEDYFDYCDKLGDINHVALIYLTECNGLSFTEAIDRVEDVQVFEGAAADYAYQLVEDCYLTSNTPDIFRYYFDYESFARDLEIGGDICYLRIDGTDYVITNANEM